MATVTQRTWTYKGKPKSAWRAIYTDRGGKQRQKTFPRKRDAEAYLTRIQYEI